MAASQNELQPGRRPRAIHDHSVELIELGIEREIESAHELLLARDELVTIELVSVGGRLLHVIDRMFVVARRWLHLAQGRAFPPAHNRVDWSRGKKKNSGDHGS